MFNFFKKNKKIEGPIGYYNLEDWWLEEFSEKEREYIIEKFKPLGRTSLIEGEISFTSQDVISFLTDLARRFKKKEDAHIALRMLKKAEELIPKAKNNISIHFFYQIIIETAYAARDSDPEGLNKAIKACEQQIAISSKVKEEMIEAHDSPLPSHRGYEQLSIIEAKKGNYDRVIELSEKAMTEGWRGDWEKRIEKAKKAVEKKN